MKKLFFLIIACLILGTVSLSFADSTISSLTEDTTPNPYDHTITVDKSDTSMGSTGTNKKVPLFNIAGISGISPYTDNTYSHGGVTLTQSDFGRTLTFDGATSYQIWMPEWSAGTSGYSIEFVKLGTGGITIYPRPQSGASFIGTESYYLIPPSGTSEIAVAKLRSISGTTLVEVSSYNIWTGTTRSYLTQINQPLSTGVTPTFAGVIINGLISVLSGVSTQGEITLFDSSGNSIFYVDSSGVSIYDSSGNVLTSITPSGASIYVVEYNSPSTTIGPSGVTTDNLRVDSGVSVPELNCETGVTTPTSCLWQATSGESIFVIGNSLYFSDSTGVDHALH